MKTWLSSYSNEITVSFEGDDADRQALEFICQCLEKKAAELLQEGKPREAYGVLALSVDARIDLDEQAKKFTEEKEEE